jgi:hypothetical protein
MGNRLAKGRRGIVVDERETRTTSRHISPERKLLLAVAAGGRCEFRGCNKYLLEHPISLSGVNLSENAHIYGFSERGPRGNEPGRPADIHAIDNLMQLCGDCHKEIDKNEDLYSVAMLQEQKRVHEERIRFLTGLGREAHTSIVILKAGIGGRAVDIAFDEVHDAVDPRYPRDRKGEVIDLTEFGDETSEAYYIAGARRITQRLEMFYQRQIDGSAPAHVSVFALAPIPLLVHFGRCLSDKVELDLFQRHHGEPKAWRWQSSGTAARYGQRLIRAGRDAGKVALVLSLSGVVDLASLPPEIDEAFCVYEIRLVSEEPNRRFLRQKSDLTEFRRVYEAFLAHVVAYHASLAELHMFPAVPAPVAIMCGHAVLPKVHSALVVYDNDKSRGGFVSRLTVNHYDK